MPKLPPGVDMLSIAKSGSFSTAETSNHDGDHGLGIASRPAIPSKIAHEDEKRTKPSKFISHSSASTRYSKYSI
jgi:hypothetical protein